MKCKVSSGEFHMILSSDGKEAIEEHDSMRSILSHTTRVQELDENNVPTGKEIKLMRKAGKEAIEEHDSRSMRSILSHITRVQELDENNVPTGKEIFLGTKFLIKSGFGNGPQQYKVMDEDIISFPPLKESL